MQLKKIKMLILGALMAVSGLSVAGQNDDKTLPAGKENVQETTSAFANNAEKPVFVMDSLYAAPEDASDDDGNHLRLSFNAAITYAKRMNEENYLGFDDWRVPTDKELEALIDNKDELGLKGTFDESSGTHGEWYRTAPKLDYSDFVSYRRPRDGKRETSVKTIRASLRLVRGSIQ